MFNVLMNVALSFGKRMYFVVCAGLCAICVLCGVKGVKYAAHFAFGDLP